MYAGYREGNQTFLTRSAFFYPSVLYLNEKHMVLQHLLSTLEQLFCLNEYKHLFANRTSNFQTIVDKNYNNTKTNKAGNVCIT
jgi:hypothetical protein